MVKENRGRQEVLSRKKREIIYPLSGYQSKPANEGGSVVSY